jgi:hypothetical protein
MSKISDQLKKIASQLEQKERQQSGQWIEWSGGFCPVIYSTLVEVRYPDGCTAMGSAELYDWGSGSRGIVAYRVIPEGTALETVKAQQKEIADLRAKLDKAEGWIEWTGGACPVDGDQLVQARVRNGRLISTNADDLGWWHDGNWGDIIAYRLAEPAADPERPKTWRLLLDTLKRQGEELKRKDTIILAAHQQRDHYRELADNAAKQKAEAAAEIAHLNALLITAKELSDYYVNVVKRQARYVSELRNRIRQLEANLEGEKALSAARGKEIERLRAPRKVVISQGRITWYDENGEIQSTAEGDGATMFDLLGR